MSSKFIVTVRFCTLILFCVLLSGCGSGDTEKAKNFFERTRQQDAAAMADLEDLAKGSADVGVAFYAGLANDPNIRGDADAIKAVNFYQKAEASSGAKHNLALLILQGFRSQQGQTQTGYGDTYALALLADSASKNRLESMLLLASLYDNGWHDIDPNPAIAVQWYEMAVNYANDPRAMVRLGAAYQDGVGKSKNFDQARIFLEAAAKRGMSEAQYRMSYLVHEPVQIAQWRMVAALSDEGYANSAEAAIAALPVSAQGQIRKNAALWHQAHAHQKQTLPSFTAPVLTP